MNFLSRLLFLLLIAFTACGPLIELEDENAALSARIDSLEIALAECGTQTDLAHERLSAIERENLQLDDNNRQLAAQIAEMRYASPPVVSGQPGSTQPGSTQPGSTQPGSTQPGSTQPGSTQPGSTQAGMPDPGPVSSGDAPAASEEADDPTFAPRRDASAVPTAVPSSTRMEVPAYDHAMKPDLAFLREYQAALSAFNAKQYDRARTVFAGLLQTSRANDMIDNCVYWLGETAMQQGQYEEAHELFSIVLGYAQSDKAPHALLARARTSLARNNDTEARADCQRILRVYPQSEQAATANELLGRMKQE
jgi:TolA-binding protein